MSQESVLVSEFVSRLTEDASTLNRRALRIGLSAAAFALFVSGCLALAFSANLAQTAAGIALQCVSGLMVAVVRHRV